MRTSGHNMSRLCEFGGGGERHTFGGWETKISKKKRVIKNVFPRDKVALITHYVQGLAKPNGDNKNMTLYH